MNISKDAAASIQALYEALLPILRELCLLEEGILAAAADDKPEKLEKLVTDAQPALLKFRGIEKKREALETELQIKGKKLSELLTLLPIESREKIEPLFQETESLLRRFSEARENVERIMQLRLNDINLRLEGIPAPKSFQDRRV